MHLIAPNFSSRLFNHKMLICIISGFSSGLPFFLLISLLPAWLKSQSVSLTQIGLYSLLMLPYSLKLFWAPVLDHYALTQLGRRRSWMILSLSLLVLSIPLLGNSSIHQPVRILLCGFVVSFCSATLDIALDALRREILDDSELGLGSSLHVNAYKIAGIIPGSLGMILSDHIAWPWVFDLCAVFLLPGLLMTIVLSEPVNQPPPPQLRQSLLLPWYDFLQRLGKRPFSILIGFILLYKLGDGLAAALTTPFYLDLGYSRTSIGLVAKQSGLLASVSGSILGGILMLRYSIRRSLLLFGLIQSLSILPFYALSRCAHPGIWSLSFSIASEAFGVGLGTTALVACIAQHTNRQFSASQFALLSSAAALPRTLINAGSGWLVLQLGWSQFFILAWALSLPGLILIRYLPASTTDLSS